MSKDNITEKDELDNSPITFEEFSHYLLTINKTPKCLICDNNKWDLLTYDTYKNPLTKDEMNVVATLPATSGILSSDNFTQFFQNSSYNLLVMSCNNCGYTNLFNYEFVYNKIRKIKKDK
ncbi:hypothetical protein [Arsenophonus nasoniae]|uniref:Uncharacterized protein n=1 Tax=Arsenophonus nasoniae TaxID=638 RepID=A0AA95K1L2_9GAMM|nr:hypothetical protein [Arsenophonus nasoniae]WGL95986.1 hypothetical protein QE207_05210 [Arsenophonus nasoniae]